MQIHSAVAEDTPRREGRAHRNSAPRVAPSLCLERGGRGGRRGRKRRDGDVRRCGAMVGSARQGKRSTRVTERQAGRQGLAATNHAGRGGGESLGSPTVLSLSAFSPESGAGEAREHYAHSELARRSVARSARTCLVRLLACSSVGLSVCRSIGCRLSRFRCAVRAFSARRIVEATTSDDERRRRRC